jgi:hypothetical protein
MKYWLIVDSYNEHAEMQFSGVAFVVRGAGAIRLACVERGTKRSSCDTPRAAPAVPEVAVSTTAPTAIAMAAHSLTGTG